MNSNRRPFRVSKHAVFYALVYSPSLYVALSLSAHNVLAATTLADLENMQQSEVINTRRRDVTTVRPEEEQNIKENVASRLYSMAEKSNNPAVLNAYLSALQKLENANKQPSEQDVLAYRAQFYEKLLPRLDQAKLNDDLYYDLAATYDLLGQTDKAAVALDTLLKRFPNTKYLQESQFRLAESYFKSKNYTAAIPAYQKVISTSQNDKFILQAKYALAWSYYKSDANKQALPMFHDLINTLNAKITKTKGEDVLLGDAYNTMALVFVQLGGAPALAEYFNNQPLSDLETLSYRNVVKRYTVLKQPFDIAQTYEGFIKRHAYAKETFEFSNALIKVYVDAGYADDVIRVKNQYIERFKTSGEYFARSDSNTQQLIKVELKTHLNDLAAHYHTVAQRNQDVATYKKAASLYTDLLALMSTPAEKVTVIEKLAESLYGATDYTAAIPYFEDLAYSLPSKNPENAGYFALLSYQALKKPLVGTARQAMLEKEKASTLKYVATFPTHANAYQVLKLLSGQYLELKDYATVLELVQIQLKLPNLSHDQKRDSTILLANTLFDQKDWKAAETAYRHVLGFNLDTVAHVRYKNQLAATLYEQANAFDLKTNIPSNSPAWSYFKGEASRFYVEASNTTMDPAIKEDALYQAADVWEDKPEAITSLRTFYERYPNSARSKNILERIVSIQTQASDFAGASQTYQQIYTRDYTLNKKNALNALWLAAESEGKINTTGAANTLTFNQINLYKKYLAEAGADLGLVLDASDKLYAHAKASNNATVVQEEINRGWQLYQQHQSTASADDLKRLKYYAARAKAQANEPILAAYLALPITQPLKDSIAKKKQGLQEVIESQKFILDLSIAEYVGQAQYNLGNSYTNFYQSVMNAPKPEGLDDVETEQYDLVIEEQVQPLKDKAVEFHKRNVTLATSTPPVWDKWIALSFDTLAEIVPGRYSRPIKAPYPVASDIALKPIELIVNKPENQKFATSESVLAPLYTTVDNEVGIRGAKKVIRVKSDTTPFDLANSLRAAKKSQHVDIDQINLSNALWYKAYIQMRKGQFNESLATLQTAEAAYPLEKSTYLLKGSIYELYLNDPQKALSAYENALLIDPDDKNTQKWINIVQKTLGVPLTKFGTPKPVTPLPEANTDQGKDEGKNEGNNITNTPSGDKPQPSSSSETNGSPGTSN